MRTWYPAILDKDPESDFGVTFPDFPGCVSGGETMAEALTMAEEALALHLEGMVEEGLPIPDPSLGEGLLARIDRVSGPRGRSAFLAQAATMALRDMR